MHEAGLSFLHFVFLLILAGALSAEAFVLRLPLSAPVVRLLLRIDLFYGLSAIGLLLAGAARVMLGAKGWEFYLAQPFFWAKLALFGLIGVMSIWPTSAFFRWTRAYKSAADFAVHEADLKRVRRLVMAESHLLALVVLFAALMARGIGA